MDDDKFPELAKRGALFQTEGGVRVNLSAMYASFSTIEWGRWYRHTNIIEYDEFGTLPSGVECFLLTC